MRTWGEIDLSDVHEDDILDRDKAIVELWDALSEEDRENPVLDRYRDFVERSRMCNGPRVIV
jgi:hypothetical protein